MIAPHAREDETELHALEEWLRSYRFDELFDGAQFDADIAALVPSPERRMGDNPHTMGGESVYTPLALPDLDEHDLPSVCDLDDPSCGEVSSMERIGGYLRDAMVANESKRNLRLMSPDETYSNKLQSVFECTDRAFLWPHREWDENLAYDGRVLEMLSEHSLQGLMQGYVLTGRHAVFASYEAFIQIVASMTDQYAKFLHIAREVPWRGTISSLNYILTSSGWRQEHNGFSHQNPGFIDGVLQRQGCFTNVYFPADANTALVVMEQMLQSTEEINVLVAGKRPLPCWRSLSDAREDLKEGIRIWEFVSDSDPHIVFAAAGDYLTKEVLAAINLIHREIPQMRVRFVNITSLSALGMGHTGCRVLRHDMTHYFTDDKPVVINFHGYPQTIKQVLFDYGCDAARFSVHGYEEEGSTTTPFDMMVRNKTDRYHLAMEAYRAAAAQGLIGESAFVELEKRTEETLLAHREYIIKHGIDPEEISTWVWESRSS